MEQLVIALVILAAIIWLIRRSASRSSSRTFQSTTPTPAVTISISTGPSGSDTPDMGEPVPTPEGGWILNPKATFPLTILGVDGKVAQELKRQLDSVYAGGYYEGSRAITPVVARSNLRCKEIDEYVAKFKPVYLGKIEESKRNSPEWAQASEKDKEDMLVSFREQALTTLDVRPYCELEVLLEMEPQDAIVDDALIDRYGFQPVQLYFRYAGDLGKVRVIPADHRDRKGLENLVQQGLARRGTDTRLPDILAALKLQDLNKLLTTTGAGTVSRKAKAIEILREQPDIKERLGETVAFRELFQLLPLPFEFAGIDLQQVASTWRYTGEVADLITHTYMMAGYATRDRDGYKKDQSVLRIKGWQLLPAQDACPHCQRAAQKTHTQMPRNPLHVGCRCTVSPLL